MKRPFTARHNVAFTARELHVPAVRRSGVRARGHETYNGQHNDNREHSNFSSLVGPHLAHPNSQCHVEQRLLRRRTAAILPASGSSTRTGRLLPPAASAGISAVCKPAIRWTRLPATTTAADSICATTRTERRRGRLRGVSGWSVFVLLCRRGVLRLPLLVVVVAAVHAFPLLWPLIRFSRFSYPPISHISPEPFTVYQGPFFTPTP